jgi:protein transport protein SEC24
MADYNMYHSLGQGEELDPNDPNRTSQPAPPMFNPPIAPHPYQQHQQQPPQQHQQSPQQYGQPWQQANYAPPHPQAGGGMYDPHHAGTPPAQGWAPPAGQDDALAAQMGGMNLGADGAAARKKKKDRHAYHMVEAAGSSAPFQGMPQPGAQGADFLNSSAPAFGQQPDHFVGGGGHGGGHQFAPGFQASPAAFGAAPGQDASAVVSTGASGRISLDDLPSVPQWRDSAQPHWLANVYPTFEKHHPPPATNSYVAFDQGNSSPKFVRLTINNIPSTAESLANTGVPLGLLLQPLAALAPGELEIPCLDFGDSGPPRCRRCRAYINPFMMFKNGGNNFVCNLCTFPNETPPDYFAVTTADGVRVDRDQRPELHRGTVEFLVPKEYWTREPTGLRWLFLIDVTQESYNKGFLETFCEGILAALYSGDEGEDGEVKRAIPLGSKVGFITFDKDIHFYNIRPGLEQAQMMIMPDLEEPFVPLSEGLFVDPYESKSVITSLLTRLPQMFSEIKNPEPAMLAALDSAIAALEETGGKIVASLSALSTWGPGRLHLREDKHPGGDVDKTLFTTELPGWRKAADRMVAAGIGTDLFLAAPSGGFLDIATVGHVSATTGGETFYYPNFIAPRDGPKLALEIKHAVTRATGFQALMKVRCSNGLQIQGYHGNFVQHTFGADLELGTIDEDKAMAVTFQYDGKLDSKLDAHFQMALLYTTVSGERRVRCCNVIASVSDHAHECVQFVDQDAVCSTLAKEAATRFGTTSASLQEIRTWISSRTIDILASHRRTFSNPAPPSELVMPNRLKELAMLALCMTKTRAYKAGSETVDRRIHELRMLRAFGARELSLYLYPRFLAIHKLEPEEGFPDATTGHLRVPNCERASFSRVDPGGVYLVDNGQQCILWMHSQTSPNLIEDLFGEGKTALTQLDVNTSTFPVLQTHINVQVRNLVEWLRAARGSKGLTIQLARQGIDGAEYEFARMLVEDRNNEAQSYVDWLSHLHRSVQIELSGKKDTTSEKSGISSTFAGLRPPYW